jgi:omega-3 fatty acid desaturase (delta-15 desaturase)
MKFYILSIFIIAYAKLSQSFHRTIFKTSLSVNRATTLNTDTKTITTRNKLIDPVDEILLEEAKHLEPKDSFDPLRLSNIRKALPSSVFEKSLFKSVRYMLQDYAVIFASFIAIWTLTHSGLWVTLPVVAKALASLAYWNVCGFYMWCIFVVGHDCGHGSFSNNRLVNDILGHIAHGSILVPFYPWQVHKLHNNHIR